MSQISKATRLHPAKQQVNRPGRFFFEPLRKNN